MNLMSTLSHESVCVRVGMEGSKSDQSAVHRSTWESEASACEFEAKLILQKATLCYSHNSHKYNFVAQNSPSSDIY